MRPRIFADPPVLCGHRGNGKGVVEGWAENTLDSYRAAVSAGVRWVEVDARLNADGVLVARHDPVLDDGRLVSAMTSAETDAAGIMRVSDLLDELPAEVGVDVDVKSALEDALRPRELTTGAAVARLLESRVGERALLVSSFDASAILIFRERLPRLPIGLLTWTRFPLRKAIPAAVHLGAEVVAAHAGSFTLPGERPPADSVAIAHEAGLEVLAWNVRPEQVDELSAAGVDCLVVDGVVSALRTAAAGR